MGRLDGRVTLITGASSGIGRASVLACVGEGTEVYATDIQTESGESLVADVKARFDLDLHFIRHDVTREEDWEDVFRELRNRAGRLDVMVNNAGIAWAGSIVDMSLEDWRRQTAVNIDGVFLGTRFAIFLMRNSGGGSIINMSSVAGIEGSPILAGYCAAKGAVRLFTKAVALECANSRWNIRVNSVHPGIIETPIWASILPDEVVAAMNEGHLTSVLTQNIPTGEAGTADDIARGVVFLASDESSYMTGSELVIDARMTA